MKLVAVIAAILAAAGIGFIAGARPTAPDGPTSEYRKLVRLSLRHGDLLLGACKARSALEDGDPALARVLLEQTIQFDREAAAYPEEAERRRNYDAPTP